MGIKESHLLQTVEFRNMIRFCHLCQTRSLAQTAEQLGVARSGVSETIGALEALCGLSLFKREFRKFIPDAVALRLSHHFLRLCLLEDFARRNINTPYRELGWVKIRWPVPACSGQVNQAFWDAVLQTQRQCKSILFCVEFYDDYLEPVPSVEEWVPAWPKLAQLDVQVVPMVGEAGGPVQLKTGGWLLLHAASAESAGHGVEPGSKVTLPRMPWPLLQQALQVCADLHLSYEYDERDFMQIVQRPPRDDRIMLLNQLCLDTACDAEWRIQPLDSSFMAGIDLRTHDDHPALRRLRHNMQRMLDRPASSLPPFTPETTVKQWHYFGLIVEHGSIRKAADALYLAQPAVSTQLRAFEQALGCTMVTRHKGSRQLALTSAGILVEQLQSGMRHMLATAQSYLATEQLQQYQHLYLGVVPSVDVNSRLSELIVDQVAKWQHAYPAVRLEILEDKQRALLALLRSQHIHMAFVEALVPWLTQEAVSAPEPMGLVVAPGLASRLGCERKQTLEWQSLRGFPLVLPRKDSGLRKLIDEHCRELGFGFVPEVESDSLNINQRWIAEGKYASVLPHSAAKSLIAAGKVLFFPLQPTLLRVIRLSYLKNRSLNRVEQSLIDYLKLSLSLAQA